MWACNLKEIPMLSLHSTRGLHIIGDRKLLFCAASYMVILWRANAIPKKTPSKPLFHFQPVLRYVPNENFRKAHGRLTEMSNQDVLFPFVVTSYSSLNLSLQLVGCQLAIDRQGMQVLVSDCGGSEPLRRRSRFSLSPEQLRIELLWIMKVSTAKLFE
jgi:hypothetical protein